MKPQTRLWLHGLFAAFIGGASTTLSSGLVLVVADPAKFNFDEGLLRLLLSVTCMALIEGAKLTFAYLKQSPLPPEPEEIAINKK
ncbi:MAG TPA: hypothetical protein VG028_13435 [Terriglobia bacterium]|nr:hypothetical protein [Terriglobia bacterium]